MRILILFISLTFVLSACSCFYADKDFNLDATEWSFLSAFKKGDTLYYENQAKQVDKILVLGIDSNQKRECGSLMALPAFNHVFVSIKHVPVDTFQTISQNGTDKIVDTIPEQIICISKYPQQKETAYSFQFKHFFFYSKKGLGQIHTDTTINGQRITNYYLIYDDFADRDTLYNKIEQLYWTQNEGLIAYKQKNGTYWTKNGSR